MNRLPFNYILAYNNNTIYTKTGRQLTPQNINCITVTEGQRVTNSFKDWCWRNRIELREGEKTCG